MGGQSTSVYCLRHQVLQLHIGGLHRQLFDQTKVAAQGVGRTRRHTSAF